MTTETTTRERPMGDVLREAANVHLAALTKWSTTRKPIHSCNAALRAEDTEKYDRAAKPQSGTSIRALRQNAATDKFLRSLGCNSRESLFEEFKPGPERQGVRFMWLLLAACMADDLDITL